MNPSGPNIEPCGTPHVTGKNSVLFLNILLSIS